MCLLGRIGYLGRNEAWPFITDCNFNAIFVNAVCHRDALLWIQAIAMLYGIAQCLIEGQSDRKHRILGESIGRSLLHDLVLHSRHLLKVTADYQLALRCLTHGTADAQKRVPALQSIHRLLEAAHRLLVVFVNLEQLVQLGDGEDFIDLRIDV